jgi:hypothetical protein
MALIELDLKPALLTPAPSRTVPLPRDNRQVLHGIRALLAFIAFTTMALLLVVVAALMTARPGTGLTTMESPVTLQLLQPGPDPAVDYYAHAVFADGTERDLQLGGYILHNGLVRVELGVTSAADGGQSSCRIVIDGIRVTEETAADGGSTVCRWNAP